MPHDFWIALLIGLAVAFVFAMGFAVVLFPFRSRPVPWYRDDQNEEMRSLGINPSDRWNTTEI